jgi:hypothetical protein
MIIIPSTFSWYRDCHKIYYIFIIVYIIGEFYNSPIFLWCLTMRLGNWEFNNFYSLSSSTMSYNLCIYQKDMRILEETLDFFRYIFEADTGITLSDKELHDEIVANFAHPVATIIIKKKEITGVMEPIPEKILIRTKNLFCASNIKEISKVIRCPKEETIYSAIFKANLELHNAGFKIDIRNGLSEDYKI